MANKQTIAPKGLDNSTLLSLISDYFPSITLYRRPDIGPESVADLGPGYILDLEVNEDEYVDLIRFLKEDMEINANILLQLSAIDWDDHFDIIVHLLSLNFGHKIFLRCPVDKEYNEIETISSIFEDAESHERQASDLFGIRFTSPTKTKPIFRQDDFPRHPFHKSFEVPEPVEKRAY